MTFDPWKQSSLQHGLDKLKNHSVDTREITSIEELKRLSGVEANVQDSESSPSLDRGKIMRELQIKPGTEEWFKLWFSKSGTGR